MGLLNSTVLRVSYSERSYRPYVSDREVYMKILRPQEIPTLVDQGFYDLGITGEDWVIETGSGVTKLMDLGYGTVRLVLAVPAGSEGDANALVREFNRSGRPLRIYTEYPNITSRYLMGLEAYRALYGGSRPRVYTPWYQYGENEMVRVFLSFGATEAKPPDEADAIVDVTSSGRTLQENGLKVIGDVLTTSAVLVANRDSLKDPWKKGKALDFVALLKGAMEARGKLHIFVNVSEENLNELVAALPSLKGPTISRLSRDGWYAVNTVIDESEYLRLLPTLRRLAQGLVVHRPAAVLSLEDVKVEEG